MRDLPWLVGVALRKHVAVPATRAAREIVHARDGLVLHDDVEGGRRRIRVRRVRRDEPDVRAAEAVVDRVAQARELAQRVCGRVGRGVAVFDLQMEVVCEENGCRDVSGRTWRSLMYSRRCGGMAGVVEDVGRSVWAIYIRPRTFGMFIPHGRYTGKDVSGAVRQLVPQRIANTPFQGLAWRSDAGCWAEGDNFSF